MPFCSGQGTSPLRQQGTTTVNSTRPTDNARHSTLLALLIAMMLALTACAQAEPVSHLREVQPVSLVSDIMFGAYTYGGIWRGMEPVLELEADLGRRLDIVHWFTNWQNDWDPRLVAPLVGTGRMPMISWQNHDVSVREIAAGARDAYIRSWAEGIREYGGLVYLRPFPEMNGDWTSWNGDPEGLVLAWRHMVGIFNEAGAHNARWVWSPNVTDEPRTEANRMENYYPGSEYVDILALDGYNWGSVRNFIGWRSFEDVFAEGYDRVTALGAQPFWVAETGSTEHGGDKAAWVQDMFTTRSFDRLEAIIWFNENKETDWTVDSSQSTLASFQAVVPLLGSVDLASSDR